MVLPAEQKCYLIILKLKLKKLKKNVISESEQDEISNDHSYQTTTK